MIHKTTRSILSVLLAALLLVTSIPLTPAFADGGGVSLQSANNESRELEQVDGVYQIGSADELREFAELVNNKGETTADAVLTANIDLSSVCGPALDDGSPVSWTPIGNSINQYSGNFDGNGKTISGLYINRSADYQGLFGYLSTDSDNTGTVKDLTVSGSVSGNDYVGGVVGLNRGSVKDCDFTGSVSGGHYVGGVVGYNNGGTVTGCIFSGSGSVSGVYNVGGVVGYNISSGNVKNCYNTGSVKGDWYVGGVAGYNSSSSSVTNCYNTGTVSGGEDVGGVVGGNDSGTVKNCYNTGKVTGSAASSNVGGVVGNNYSGTVENCYNTGEVSGGNRVGGVVGYNFSGGGSGNVTDCYFLKTETVNTKLQGIGNKGSAEGAAVVKDLSELCEKFKDNDTTDTWTTSPFYKYPVLKANPEGGLGTATHPYEIKTAAQLKTFRDIVNGANEQVKDSDAHAKLMNNIDLKDVCGESNSWIPIGNSESTAYTGTFNGNGKTISGLYINNSSDTDYQGLFGYLGTSGDNKGTVQNLSVSGSVSGHWYVGGVVGYNNGGNVTGCIFSGSGTVSGGMYVGGVVGENRGSVENCYNTGAVSGPDSGSGNSVGGVVGYNYHGTVENCYNTGTVSGSDSGSGNSVGGVVGYNHSGTVKNCYNTGEVSGPDNGTSNYVGGVVGYNNGGTVTNCYFLQQNPAIYGIGNTTKDDISQTAAKSLEDFHSGEVAYLLQSKQADGSGQVWGQTLGGEEDSLPTLVALNPGAAQPVYKVTFKYGYDSASADEISYSNGSVKFPAFERTGHTLTGWQNEDGQAVTEPITVTADTTFTAQWTKDTVNYTVTVSADPEAGGTVSGSGEYSEGTQVTVTATPATGYHFVNWTENGTEVSTEATFTFNATVDRNLIAIFAKNEEPTPTPDPTPDPTPSGPSTGDSSGWDDILDELENTAKGDQITIDMGDETKVPAEIFESLAGKDVDVTFDLGDIQWSVNGADIPTDTDFTDLDLGASLGTSGIPVNVINTITGEVGTVQITLAHDGEFGFTMTLTAPLGKENAGYWANLYHYDESAEALNFEAAAKIDEDGSVTIPFSHASQYAIVIDTHSHAAVSVSDIFVDVAPNAWYKDAVQYAYDNGLMTGVSATEFAPEATTTRAMIVSILARLENVTSAEAAGFADVDDNDWYATAVNWAANVGVVNGYEDNTFKPNTAITREQLAAILMNYAAYKGEDVSNRADLTSYTDQPSTWAEEAMSWAVAEGLISGVTNDQLQPQGNATRAQVAAILQRFLSE